jgi:hypothetical protein
MKIHNNQRNDGVGGGWDVAEETRLGGTCGGGHLPDKKIKIDRASGP